MSPGHELSRLHNKLPHNRVALNNTARMSQSLQVRSLGDLGPLLQGLSETTLKVLTRLSGAGCACKLSHVAGSRIQFPTGCRTKCPPSSLAVGCPWASPV